MRSDIYGGLKNAIERGSTLEKAIASFITAGYKESEVREAANAIDMGTIPIIEPNKNQDNKIPLPAIQTSPIQMAKKSKKGTIILIIVLLVVAAAGLIGTFLFKDQIISFIETLIA